MDFSILSRWGASPPNAKNHVYLTWDNWNDYNYYTLFGIFYIDNDGNKHDLGAVKIGFKGQGTGDRIYQEGYNFKYIGDGYFSLGTSEQYYEKLKQLHPGTRDEILSGLNDIAKNKELYIEVEEEPVVIHSLFRSLSPSTVTGQFRRIANGGVRLTPYSFSFTMPVAEDVPEPFALSFNVQPESLPPTNIHVLIGRNGVGKTYLINNMVDSLIINNEDQPAAGGFAFKGKDEWDDEIPTFANLISISFSAFDEMEPRLEDAPFANGIKYSYIGLRLPTGGDPTAPKIKDPTMLPNEFLESLSICQSRALNERWLQAVYTLQSDPYFQRAGVTELIQFDNSRPSRAAILKIFRRLSSGHKIVLLTITRLIEKLQERSLVIMDEPEAHLHPPLLSAFIRAVSDLLITTNGVAIVATHSPVILQEVPSSCARRLRRSGSLMKADALVRESFGENVGVLTNDIFGLEVTESGFYKMVSKIIEETNYDYDAVMAAFDNQLGMEARSIVMAIINNHNN